MGYEIDKIESMTLYHKETGEKICSLNGIKETALEEPTPEEANERLVTTIPKDTQFTADIRIPPRPNIMMIISPGDPYGNVKTVICFYRPKYYNWLQRFMYKICFGITIKQGDEVRREFL